MAKRRAQIFRTSTLAAFFAAIMLVFAGAGASARAAPAGCDPCPPDCPMMAQADGSAAAPAPQPANPSGDPCDPGLACPGAAATFLPSEAPAVVILAHGAADHDRLDPLAAPSRPPDRTLRPPIQL